MNKEHAEQVVVLNEKMETLEESVKNLTTTVNALNSQLTQYKGFVGGILFVISCIVTALSIWFGARH